MRKLLSLCSVLLAACGPQGPEGPPGPAGVPGPSGTGLTSTTVCQGIFVVDSGTFLHVRLSYDVYEFADGSVAVDCSVSDGSREASRFAMSGSSQRSMRCEVGFDLNNWSGGFWRFNLESPTAASVHYVDLNDPHDGAGNTLDCSSL